MTVALFASCGERLDQYPHDGISAERVNAEHAQLLITGMYNIAQYKPTFNGWALFDLIGGDLIRTGATSVNTPKLMVEGAIDPNKHSVDLVKSCEISVPRTCDNALVRVNCTFHH